MAYVFQIRISISFSRGRSGVGDARSADLFSTREGEHPCKNEHPGRSGGGAQDLLNSTAPAQRGPDDATREGAMRAGMQSINMQSGLLTPVVLGDLSMSPLKETGEDASAR